MIRKVFYILSVLSLLVVYLIYPHWHHVAHALWIIVPAILLGVYDINSHHNVLRNYPVVGHFRYMFEFVRPEIQQYFVATNLSGRPYNREQRSLVYQRSKHADDTHPFGTEHDINGNNYHFAQHSLNVKKFNPDAMRITIGGDDCKKPYNASRINTSAMSYGALSVNAVRAINYGAKLGNFAQNTGEGSLTPHHLKEGGDIIWQIGTGYFGCRTHDGNFDEAKFSDKATLDVVKMIELKLSQGAKPSHGGLLPAAKITQEIADIRGIPLGKDCLSPAMHTAFSNPTEMMHFIQKLRDLSGSKPVGFKICIGRHSEFMSICKAIIATGIKPDFITIDGAEGGTGAAPLEFTNRLGLPIDPGLAFAHNCLVGTGLRDSIRLIASGKITTGFDIITKFSLGADLCNLARPFLFAIGCIQALRCNTNTCPTGVTTQDPRRYKAVVVPEKGERVANFHQNTIESFMELAGAMGVTSPEELTPDLIHYRTSAGDSLDFSKVFHFLEPGNLLSDNIHPKYKDWWNKSSATAF